MRRLKLGKKVLGGVEPPKQPISESKEDVSLDDLEITRKKLEALPREYVQNIRLVPSDRTIPLNNAFLGVSSLRRVEFPELRTIGISESAYNDARLATIPDNTPPIIGVLSVTPGTDIRATNTIGPNFSRRQQRNIDEQEDIDE